MAFLLSRIGLVRPRSEMIKIKIKSNHRLRTRKIPKKSHFDEESTAINLQPKTFAECTQVQLKRATLNTDGRGCVARSTHQTSF
jgi:hypothetical protein